MNTFTCVIIDDEYHAREGLKQLISFACPNQFDLIVLAKSIDEGVIAIKEYYPDIVFLDINLQKNMGFELFDYFEHRSFEVVFTTGYSEYILEAVNKYGCLGYLLKPVDITELINVLDRYKEKVEKLGNYISRANKSQVVETSQDVEMVYLTSSNVIVPVALRDIIYCKADDNYCEVFTTEKKILVTKPLKEIESLLLEKSNKFYRVHRSYIVNTLHIDSYDKKESVIYLKASVHLPITTVPVSSKGQNLLKDFAI